MTLKKQFSLLASIIITIPILCICFIFAYNYMRSSDRLIIQEFSQLKKEKAQMYSKQDWKTLYNTINNLPPDIQAALVAENGFVLLSTIKEIPVNSQMTFGFLWEIQNLFLRKNYYQFSIVETTNENLLLITKVSKVKNDATKKIGTLPALLFFLFIIVLICFIFLLLIFRNISKSISTLEQQTHEIASGDLSVQINLENKANEITSISKSLELMRQSLLEVQTQKNNFIMGVSHDLRTPVAIIKGYIEALTDGIITDEKEIINTYSLIGGKTAQLENIINSLISFIKMNNGEIRETLILQSITSLINDFAQDAYGISNVFKRNVICNINLKKDYKIPMNKTLISRAFENLLSNALRYTKENDTIKIEAFENDKNEIELKIEDSGIGIEEKDLKQIFDIFYRGTNSRREEGMGIGLSVVKSIMETHNWKIEVKSKKNEGSCFTIYIPLVKES